MARRASTIRFFKPEEPFGFLCNFSPHPILFKTPRFDPRRRVHYEEELEYSTSEHLYQARKFIYPDAPRDNLIYVELIRTASTPFKAKILGHQELSKRGTPQYQWRLQLDEVIKKYPQVLPNPDWEEQKLEVMYEVLIDKFTQNEEIQAELLATGSATLQENSHYDDFWGIGKDKTGENHLGRLLMRLREELKVIQEATAVE